jgi:hypothetical protein
MRNRRLLWCLGAGAFLLLAGFAIFLVVHVLPDRIIPENCERIEVGMTEEQVEALLGGPPEIEFGRGTGHRAALFGPDAECELLWTGGGWAIFVQLDGRRWVLATVCAEQGREVREMYDLPAPTFWDKLRRSLGW